MKAELQRLVTDPVKGDELKSRQAVLTGRYARELETNQGFVAQISELATYDLPLDTLDKFIPSINAVTTEEVTAFAKKYLATADEPGDHRQSQRFSRAAKKDAPEKSRVIEQKISI